MKMVTNLMEYIKMNKMKSQVQKYNFKKILLNKMKIKD